MSKLLTAMIAVALIVACSNDKLSPLDAPKRFFAENKVGSSPDYGVIKMGNPKDHVITVHGFADDGTSCREVADALNVNACKELGGQNCLYPYSCIQLNR